MVITNVVPILVVFPLLGFMVFMINRDMKRALEEAMSPEEKLWHKLVKGQPWETRRPNDKP